MAKNSEWPLGAERGPWLTVSKEVEVSVLKLQTKELCQQYE